MRFFYLLLSSLISGAMPILLLSFFRILLDFSFIGLVQVIAASFMFSIVGHFFAFPGLLLFFILSFTLERQKRGFWSFSVLGATLALINSIFVYFVLAHEPLQESSIGVGSFLIVFFLLSGFSTGALYYNLLKTIKKKEMT